MAVRQLLVLGAGFDTDGAPNHQTLERGEHAAFYCAADGPEIDRVVFSGGYSKIAPERGRHSISEAEAMADHAVDHGLPRDLVRIEPNSTTTFTNFLNSAGLLGPNLDVGIVAHSWQMPRALLIGRRVLAQPLEALPVDEHDPVEATLQERLMFQATRLMLAGVGAGDAEGVRRRNDRMEAVADRVGPVVNKLLARNHSAFK